MGLGVVKYFRDLLPLLIGWLQAFDGVSRLLACDALGVVIQSSWPRISVHSPRIWKELLRCWGEAETCSNAQDLKAHIIQVCKLLQWAGGPAFEDCWSSSIVGLPGTENLASALQQNSLAIQMSRKTSNTMQA